MLARVAPLSILALRWVYGRYVASYVTAQVPEDALSGRTIQPYADFLLHDLGALGDGIVEGEATETEMMTRPLWGLVQRPSFLHDGRATGGTFEQNVAAAIAEHGGTATPSAQAFAALTAAEKDLVYRFLGSLGRTEFDWDANNTIDEFDWFFTYPLPLFLSPSCSASPLFPSQAKMRSTCCRGGGPNTTQDMFIQEKGKRSEVQIKKCSTSRQPGCTESVHMSSRGTANVSGACSSMRSCRALGRRTRP